MSLHDEYRELVNETTWLHMKHYEYEALFGRDAARIEVLNKGGAHFFGIVEKVLWGDLLLHLTRITGPVQSANQHNLTLQRLPELVSVGTKAAVRVAVDGAVQRSTFAKKARHKYLAHTDLHIALDPASAGFTLGSRRLMSEALTAILAAVNLVGREVDGLKNVFDFSANHGTADEVFELYQTGVVQRQRAFMKHFLGAKSASDGE